MESKLTRSNLVLISAYSFYHIVRGYYDRFFAEYQATFASRPILIGVALNPQIIDLIPTEPHDIPLDYVISPEGIS